MIFTAFRGRPFKEEFSFKSPGGKEVVVPQGNYVLHLEHGDIVREFSNLKITRTKVFWVMTSDEVDSLEFDTMYFSLAYNDKEISRGILRVK